jgi:hypothetical protein
VRAYSRIPDRAVRLKLLKLAECIADGRTVAAVAEAH